MKRIKLTKGKFAIVDNKNFDYLNQFKWQFVGGYAVRTIYNNGVQKPIFMHRLINKTPLGMDTDHTNRNKLDNRERNLRTVTNRINQLNRGLSKNNTSGYKGVYWRKERKKWRAQIGIDNKYIYLGHFSDLSNAILARKNAEKIYYKEVFLES